MPVEIRTSTYLIYYHMYMKSGSKKAEIIDDLIPQTFWLYVMYLRCDSNNLLNQIKKVNEWSGDDYLKKFYTCLII